MAPSATDHQGFMVNGFHNHYPEATNHHEKVHFDKKLTPKRHEIKGTDPSSKILFLDVNILDSTGRPPYRGDVYIEGIALQSQRT
jgi:hypothetical protein